MLIGVLAKQVPGCVLDKMLKCLREGLIWDLKTFITAPAKH
jgi:hypothetical protein